MVPWHIRHKFVITHLRLSCKVLLTFKVSLLSLSFIFNFCLAVWCGELCRTDKRAWLTMFLCAWTSVNGFLSPVIIAVLASSIISLVSRCATSSCSPNKEKGEWNEVDGEAIPLLSHFRLSLFWGVPALSRFYPPHFLFSISFLIAISSAMPFCAIYYASFLMRCQWIDGRFFSRWVKKRNLKSDGRRCRDR